MEKICEDPANKVLVDRYLALVREMGAEENKKPHMLRLAHSLSEADPREAMQFAFMVFQFDRSCIEALELVVTCLKNMGRHGKAEVIQNEVAKLKELAMSDELPDDSGHDRALGVTLPPHPDAHPDDHVFVGEISAIKGPLPEEALAVSSEGGDAQGDDQGPTILLEDLSAFVPDVYVPDVSAASTQVNEPVPASDAEGEDPVPLDLTGSFQDLELAPAEPVENTPSESSLAPDLSTDTQQQKSLQTPEPQETGIAGEEQALPESSEEQEAAVDDLFVDSEPSMSDQPSLPDAAGVAAVPEEAPDQVAQELSLPPQERSVIAESVPAAQSGADRIEPVTQNRSIGADAGVVVELFDFYWKQGMFAQARKLLEDTHQFAGDQSWWLARKAVVDASSQEPEDQAPVADADGPVDITSEPNAAASHDEHEAQQAQVWQAYLLKLVASGRSRKALHEIRTAVRPESTAHWAVAAMHCLPKVWSELGLRGFSWQPEDGVQALVDLLSERRSPTMAAAGKSKKTG